VLLLLASASGLASTWYGSENFSLDTSIPRIDTDDDGMTDAWELAHGLDPVTKDEAEDPDHDGYTNLEEYNAGTDPHVYEPVGLPHAVALFALTTRLSVADTDGDGMPDWWEDAHGLNPLVDDSAADTDGDGRSNIVEYNADTDPQVDDWRGPTFGVTADLLVDTGGYPFDLGADTDGDGMPDWWEFKYGLNWEVPDGGDDLDGDGVSNVGEYLMGTRPDVNDISGLVWCLSSLFGMDTVFAPPDRDGDGMRDWWEIAHGLDPDIDDANEDPDGDGRSNIDEYNAGTDPHVDDWRGPTRMESLALTVDTGGYNGGYADDSDGDGMPDWWEIRHGLNPLLDDTTGNPDGDALNNLEEYNAGTDPQRFDWWFPQESESLVFLVDTGGFYVDTDGDGIPNWWERIYVGNTTGIVANVDSDGDGHMNWQEFITRTHPGDPGSVFHVEGVTRPDPEHPWQWVITWATAPNRLYSVYSGTNLLTTWPSAPIHQVQGDGTPKSYTNTVENTQPRFYRITVQLSPGP
jgi:hypothetical protein